MPTLPLPRRLITSTVGLGYTKKPSLSPVAPLTSLISILARKELSETRKPTVGLSPPVQPIDIPLFKSLPPTTRNRLSTPATVAPPIPTFPELVAKVAPVVQDSVPVTARPVEVIVAAVVALLFTLKI